jgi:hypothetical protein
MTFSKAQLFLRVTLYRKRRAAIATRMDFVDSFRSLVK